MAGVISTMGPEQLGRMIEQHAAALVLYARQWCAAPEDVVQEAFVKLMAQTPPPSHVVSWLYRVVRNAALSAARSEKRRKSHENRRAEQTLWFTTSDATTLDAETATRALQNLPLEEREIIVAHLWGGLTFDQIAELAGCSSSTVHRRYLAGLASLRERLKVPCP